jgi:hypothetical protein
MLPLSASGTSTPHLAPTAGARLRHRSPLPPAALSTATAASHPLPPLTTSVGTAGAPLALPPPILPSPASFFHQEEPDPPPTIARRTHYSHPAPPPTSVLRPTHVPSGGRCEGAPLRCPLADSPHTSPHEGEDRLVLPPPSPPSQTPLTHGARRVGTPPFTHPICSSRVLRFQPHVALPFPSTASHRRRPTSPRTQPSSSGNPCEGTLNLTLPKPSFPSQNIASPNHLPPLATSVSQNFTSPNPLSPIATFPAVSCPTMALHLPSRTKFPIYPPTSSSPHPPTSSYPLNSPQANHLARLACFPNNFFPSLPMGPKNLSSSLRE